MNAAAMTLPAAAAGLSEATSVAIAQQIKWATVQMPSGSVAGSEMSSVATSYVCQGTGQPVLLLHGFDSSLFEFRRLVPLLAAHVQVWAVDLLGFGFGDRLAAKQVTPETIKQHLLSFCEQVIGQPVVMVGASMGGGAAIDFALSYPDWVKQLVLIDAVGFAKGPAVGKLMFAPLDRWATNFLSSPKVRRKISEKAYCDPSFVTPDASLCASLHLLMPNWHEALIAFTKSGGYNFLSDKISQIALPTLVLWGKQDKILGVKDAARFERAISQCKLVWIEDCGHVPHLERARITADYIVSFI
jgi:pimeloyl-ACP methyl ester carboxylesterase